MMLTVGFLPDSSSMTSSLVLIGSLGCGAGSWLRFGFRLAVVEHAEPDAVAALGTAMAVGVAQRIDAAAVFLLVEGLALGDLDHPGRAALLAPVVVPVDEVGITRCGADAAAVDLRHVLPARDP